jgi:Domain of unknown function (DUF222)
MVEQRRELTRAQAALAATMLDFTDTRITLDEAAQLGQRNARGGRRMRPGEFASTEIALALLDTRNRISGRVGTYRLLRDQQPTVWRAFRAGHVPPEAADLIAGTVRRLVKGESIALLDKLVVDVAACTALPLLDRWLQQFITRSEPEQQDERTRRKLADRRVRVRPDVDGVSSLWASLSCLDAAAIDAVLTALASSTAPSDPRTKQQRRADALVDLLLGRVSNGCHVTWIPTADPESGTPEPEFGSPAVDTENPFPDREAPSSDADLDPWELTPADHRPTPTIEPSEPAVSLPIECLTVIHESAPNTWRAPNGAHDSETDEPATDADSSAGTDTSAGADTSGDSNVPAVAEVFADADQAPTEPAHDTGSPPPEPTVGDTPPDVLNSNLTTPPAGSEPGTSTHTDLPADADPFPPKSSLDAEPPASESIDASPSQTDVTRPTDDPSQTDIPQLTDDPSATDATPPAPATDCGKPRRRSTVPEGLPPPTLPLARIRVRDSAHANSTDLGTILITPCLGDCVPRALPTVTIGVVVTLPSLLGATNTPGQLADRTGSIPADTIRSLAAHPDTRLHRLLSTPAGTLLDVTELGRYPSPKLATAVRWRDATCITPGCTTSAGGCDLDHIVPHPHGPTAACNLGPGCRHNHRAKTHADHRVSRDADGTYTWTTPTGHTYHRTTPPLPVENWPNQPDDPDQPKD